MTEKKEKILEAALELFAREGFGSTSTSKVARLAGVSEGLIFRHFENKEGLLEAIMGQGEERAATLFGDIIGESDPLEVLRKTIAIGPKLTGDTAAADFWKLQYKLKWELEQYNEHKVQPLQQALTKAFADLGYDDPSGEAMFLSLLMDGIATRYFLTEGFDIQAMADRLLIRYGL